MLCPILTEDMAVRGKFGDDYFDYIDITLYECNLGSDCEPDDVVFENGFNFFTIQQLPSLLNDPEQSINPVEKQVLKFFDPKIS